jgi:hypothetical protein
VSEFLFACREVTAVDDFVISSLDGSLTSSNPEGQMILSARRARDVKLPTVFGGGTVAGDEAFS